jgi:hypothetical protein
MSSAAVVPRHYIYAARRICSAVAQSGEAIHPEICASESPPLYKRDFQLANGDIPRRTRLLNVSTCHSIASGPCRAQLHMMIQLAVGKKIPVKHKDTVSSGNVAGIAGRRSSMQHSIIRLMLIFIIL